MQIKAKGERYVWWLSAALREIGIDRKPGDASSSSPPLLHFSRSENAGGLFFCRRHFSSLLQLRPEEWAFSLAAAFVMTLTNWSAYCSAILSLLSFAAFGRRLYQQEWLQYIRTQAEASASGSGSSFCI